MTASIQKVELHQLRNREIEIQVRYSGVNRADLLQLTGDYAPPEGESDIPGLECSGIVTAVGTDVKSFQLGEHVCCLLASGGHGERVRVDERLVLPTAPIELKDAAVLPEAVCTAWLNLDVLGEAKPGERVLIYGANSGVGHLTIQVARELGLHVIAVARGTRWKEALLQLDIEQYVDVTDETDVKKMTTEFENSVNLVIDLVGAASTSMTYRVLASQGRWVIVGILSGASGELNMRQIIRKRLHITGASLRSLPAVEKFDIVAQVREWIWPAVMAGRIRPYIFAEFPSLPKALDFLQRESMYGKLLVNPNNDAE